MKVNFFMLAGVLLAWSCNAVLGGQRTEILYSGEQGAGAGLAGWYDIFGNHPPKAPEQGHEGMLAGRKAVITGKVCFGIVKPLAQPVVIDGNLKMLRLTVDLLKPAKFSDYLVEMALTTRVRPAGEDGRAFKPGADSGLSAAGYIHDLQRGNMISWRKNGQDVQCRRSMSPYAFLKAHDSWQTWKIEYDYPNRSLKFFQDAGSKPFLVQRNVDLTGLTMNGVWLTAWGCCYSRVQVDVETR